MASASDEGGTSPLSQFIGIIGILFCLFVAPKLMGDVSLEGLDAYVLSLPAGSSREQIEAAVKRFEHCFYRPAHRSMSDHAADYVFRGTSSDVGLFVSVKVHCEFGLGGLLAGRCSRSQWALIPANVEAFEKWSGWNINQADEWSNYNLPECPVRD